MAPSRGQKQPHQGLHETANADGADSQPTSPSEDHSKRRAERPSSIVTALSGALSGSLISACVQPLDVIRTKMQGDAAKNIHRGTLSTVQEIVKAGGIRALWQGTGPSVLRVGLGAALQFVVLEQVKTLLSVQLADGTSQLSAMGAAISGGFSRAVATVALCPITVVKTRMEYATNDPAVPRYRKLESVHHMPTGLIWRRNTGHALLSITQREGARGLFKGLLPTILTNAPFSGLYYMFYSHLKTQLSGEGRPTAVVNFCSGTFAAVAATLLTQPADVVRTRMQLGVGNVRTMDTLGHVMRQGTRGMLTGAVPRLLKRTSQTALVWTLYEELLPRLQTVMTGVTAALAHKAQQGQQIQPGAPRSKPD